MFSRKAKATFKVFVAIGRWQCVQYFAVFIKQKNLYSGSTFCILHSAFVNENYFQPHTFELMMFSPSLPEITHLCKRSCPSVRRSVGRPVGPSQDTFAQRKWKFLRVKVKLHQCVVIIADLYLKLCLLNCVGVSS